MKREPESEARRWLLQAKHDLDDANFSLEGERFNLACFPLPASGRKGVKSISDSQLKGAVGLWLSYAKRHP